MRLFTAFDLPEGWRDEAGRTQQQLLARFADDLRPVQREQFHVTVRFLGEIASERAAALTTAIEELPPIEVSAALAPAGTFGAAARTSVVWLGVEFREDDAGILLDSVDRAISEAGLIPPAEAWRPHLTLARVRRQIDAERRREIAVAVRDLAPPDAAAALVGAVSLYRSDLGSRAPRHKLLARSAVS